MLVAELECRLVTLLFMAGDDKESAELCAPSAKGLLKR